MVNFFFGFIIDFFKILKLLFRAPLFIYTFIQSGFRDLKTPTINAEIERQLFDNIRKELSAKDSPELWKKYLIFNLSIQIIFIGMALFSIYFGAWLSFGTLVLLLCLSLVVSGYKPWILKYKKYVSFSQYLVQLPKDWAILWLPSSLHLIEDLWQDQSSTKSGKVS